MTTDNSSDTRMVPESDLMAVKANLSRLESENTDLKSQLAEWKTNATTAQDTFRRVEVDRDSALTKIEDLTNQIAEIPDLRTQLASANAQLETANTRIVEGHKSTLKSLGIPDSLLEGKTPDEMMLMQNALSAVNHRPNTQARLDAGGGGGGSTSGNLTGRKVIQQALDSGERSKFVSTATDTDKQ